MNSEKWVAVSFWLYLISMIVAALLVQLAR